jgi:hypothetical protein
MATGHIPRTKQGEKERAMIAQRVMRLGESYVKMERRLEQYPKWILLNEASLLVQQRKCMTIDRLAARHRQALICWFAEFDFEQIYRTELRIHSSEYPRRSLIAIATANPVAPSIPPTISNYAQEDEDDFPMWDDTDNFLDERSD